MVFFFMTVGLMVNSLENNNYRTNFELEAAEKKLILRMEGKLQRRTKNVMNAMNMKVISDLEIYGF